MRRQDETCTDVGRWVLRFEIGWLTIAPGLQEMTVKRGGFVCRKQGMGLGLSIAGRTAGHASISSWR